MKQNTLSIDFKFARVSGNTYTFGYDVYRSVTASTEITVQNWNNKAAIPAYYDKANQRLYAYNVNGYWAVFADTLTFTSVQPDSGRIDDLETRVSALETSVESLETYVNAIVLSLNNAIICRGVNSNMVSFSDAIATNLNNVAVSITPTQSGSGDPSSENIRPITGVSSVAVTRTGKNLFDITEDSNTVNGITFTVNRSAGTITANGTASSVTPFYFNRNIHLPSGNYLYTCDIINPPDDNVSGRKAYAQYTNADESFWSQPIAATGEVLTLNRPDETGMGVIYVKSGITLSDCVFKPMLRLADDDTDSAFEPCHAQSVTVSIVDSNSSPLTVYGGTLDVTTGMLSVTWANIASYDGETLPGRWISDRDVYAPNATPTTGAQVVYELAAPVTYQLTLKNLTTLEGYNAIRASVGIESVSVIYMSKITLEE